MTDLASPDNSDWTEMVLSEALITSAQALYAMTRAISAVLSEPLLDKLYEQIKIEGQEIEPDDMLPFVTATVIEAEQRLKENPLTEAEIHELHDRLKNGMALHGRLQEDMPSDTANLN